MSLTSMKGCVQRIFSVYYYFLNPDIRALLQSSGNIHIWPLLKSPHTAHDGALYLRRV